MARIEHEVGEVIEIAGKKYIAEESDFYKGCRPCDLFGICSIEPYLSLTGLCSKGTRTDRKEIVYKKV